MSVVGLQGHVVTMRIDAINSSQSVAGATLNFCHVVNQYLCCVAACTSGVIIAILGSQE